MNKVAAFFDFDETIIITDTSNLLGKYFRDNKTRAFCGKDLSLPFYLKTIVYRLLHLTPLVDYEKLNEVLFEFWKGRSKKLLIEWMNDFYFDYVENKLSPTLMNKISEHREQGHILIMVSAGISDMLQTVADNLNFDHLISTELEVDDEGYYTGKIPKGACMGNNKQLFAQQIAKEQKIDLDNSFSYGNHHNDIPILEIVGNPCAVEPTKKLLQVSQNRGWPVLSFH